MPKDPVDPVKDAKICAQGLAMGSWDSVRVEELFFSFSSSGDYQRST